MKKKPQNWIQGLSVQERKKQGITTVMPGDKGFGKFLDNDKVINSNQTIEDSLHYNVGQVDVEVDHSHMNKLRILHMTLHNWEKNNAQVPIDSRMGRVFESDLQMVEELTERGTTTMLEDDKEFLGTDKFLTRDEMLILNDLFKTYGGERVT
jgi:hypothetical protein